jgi:hypothetical protein
MFQSHYKRNVNYPTPEHEELPTHTGVPLFRSELCYNELTIAEKLPNLDVSSATDFWAEEQGTQS